MKAIKSKFIFGIILFLAIVNIFGFIAINQAQALSLMDGVSESCWTKDGGKGDCTVCDVLRVFFNGARFIFISMSGVVLIMIIWAAVGLILNWGNAEAVGRNKKLIMHTLLGVVIILMSWTLVNAIGWFFLGANSAGLQDPKEKQQQVWEKGWWVGPVCN